MSMSFSQLVDFVPPPVLLGAMGNTDQDGAWLIDATKNMQRRNTTITAIGAVTVARKDGEPIGLQDPTVSAVATQSAGLKWSFRVTTAGNIARYYLGFPLTLANGDVITRWFELPVVPMIG